MTFGSIFGAMIRTEGPGILQTIIVVSMTAVMAAIPLAWGLFIIVRSDKCAAWLVRDDKTVEIGSSINKEDVLLVVFSCIGLYLIVTAFPNLLLNIPQFFAVRKAGSDYFAYTSGGLYKTLRLAAPVVQIALGVWLFVGSRGIVKLWKKIRG